MCLSALLPSHVDTHLLGDFVAVLLWHNSGEHLLNIFTLFLRHRSADRHIHIVALFNLFIVSILLGNILTNLSWHIMALLPRFIPALLLWHIIAHHLGHIVAGLPGLIPALLLRHIFTDHVGNIMAFLSRLVPTFLFRNILAFHGRNISTLLFTISILSTHWLLNKVTFPHCFGSTYPLGDSIAHFLHTLFALSDSLLSAHSFVVCGAHFFWFRVTLALSLSFALSVILSFTFLISNSVALFLLLGLCHRLGHLLTLHGGGVVALLFHDDIAHILGDSLLLGLQLCLTFLLLLSVAFLVNLVPAFLIIPM